MKFDSCTSSCTKTVSTAKNYTKIRNKPEFDKEKFSLKKAAFTLAETLITLTIIGVIAALTIPNLISNYQKHTYVVGLKKANSNLQNAWKMIPINQGCPAGDYECAGLDVYWRTPVLPIDGKTFQYQDDKNLYILSKQFKVQYSDFNRNCTNTKAESGFSCFVTDDGMQFTSFDKYIDIDINGKKGPNKIGRDIFTYTLLPKDHNCIDIITNNCSPVPIEILPFGILEDANFWKTKCLPTNINESCTARVLIEDAMNY